MSLNTESARSPVVGNGNPFQYSYLENSMGRAAWWATIHWAAKNMTQLNDSAQHMSYLSTRRGSLHALHYKQNTREKEQLLFFAGKDTANEKTWTLCLLPLFQFPFPLKCSPSLPMKELVHGLPWLQTPKMHFSSCCCLIAKSCLTLWGPMAIL